MGDDAATHRRRRRRRGSDAAPSARPAADAPAPSASPRRHRRDSSDGALRDLVGAGPSQLGVERALRARDVNRPSVDELAAAEREVVIVRRDWRPPS